MTAILRSQRGWNANVIDLRIQEERDETQAELAMQFSSLNGMASDMCIALEDLVNGGNLDRSFMNEEYIRQVQKTLENISDLTEC